MELKKNNVIPLQIIPIPSSKVSFSSNKLIVEDPIIDNSLNFTHTGTYTITSSSFASNNTLPYNAFNNISSKYWQCDYMNNKDFGNTIPPPTYTKAYTKNPYTNSATGNSAYQGGGSSENKWSTIIGQGSGGTGGKGSDTTPIFGEWIQIHIPKEIPAYLFRYSILTPIPKGNALTFPTKFIILGSETGPDKEGEAYNWQYVDQQNLATPKDTSSQVPVVFNLNSTNSYHYYRLIITEMPPNNSIVRISQFTIDVMPILTINRDAFTTMSNSDMGVRSLQYFNLLDSHRNSHYVDYKLSQPLQDKKVENYMLENGISNEKESIDQYVLLPGFLLSILAISILVYSVKNK